MPLVFNHYYMRRLFVLVSFTALNLCCYAQKVLQFANATTQQFITVKVGNRVAILYKGYLGQVEFVRETVTEITDSTIVVGTNYAEQFPSLVGKPGKNNKLTYKVIRIQDIVGFRKIGLGRQLGKLVVSAAGIVGSFYFLRGVYKSNLSNASTFFISMGTGFCLLAINSILFPENIKYYFAEGWSVQVVPYF